MAANQLRAGGGWQATLNLLEVTGTEGSVYWKVGRQVLTCDLSDGVSPKQVSVENHQEQRHSPKGNTFKSQNKSKPQKGKKED